jgi:hypothetical protein
MRLARNPNGPGIELLLNESRLGLLSQEARDLLTSIAERTFLERVECYMMSDLLGNGPKVFRPTAYQMFMLERMQLNIEVKDFNTPFRSMVIELPEEYAKAKQAGENPPNMVQFLFDKDTSTFMSSVILDEEGDLRGLKSWWRGDPEQMVEDWFDYRYTEDTRVSDLPTTEKEYAMDHVIRRAVVNYCLLLDEVGTKKVGPASPNAYAQLVKWVAKNNNHTAKNRLNLTAQPIIYDLDKPVVLQRTIRDESALPASPSGKITDPHSRRGHYRMQPYGPRNALRKRIRIPPTFVNRHLLLGDDPPTQTYQT